MKILRVFPRRIKAATPDDDMAVVGRQPELTDYGRCDEVHVSVTFDWDKPKGEMLAEAWQVLGVPVKLGGPAYNTKAGEFTPGLYLKKGYVITSRGCPNKCDFCKVPEREGPLRTLKIKDGWNVLDNNLLACPIEHQQAVFDMLDRQRRPVRLTGGLEAARFTPWHATRLSAMRIESIWMAYDYPADYEPLRAAVALLRGQLVREHARKKVGAYVLMVRIEFVCPACGSRRFFVRPRKSVRCTRCGRGFTVTNFDLLEIFQNALGDKPNSARFSRLD